MDLTGPVFLKDGMAAPLFFRNYGVIVFAESPPALRGRSLLVKFIFHAFFFPKAQFLAFVVTHACHSY